MGSSNPIIHRKKLFDGRYTAEELNAKLAWGDHKCDGCGGPPAIRISVYVALNDMEMTLRHAVMFEISQGRINTVPTTNGDAVRTSFVHACKNCQATAERAAARGAPSFAIVDIQRGPGPDAPMIQVVGS